jgi:hypothetical protein
MWSTCVIRDIFVTVTLRPLALVCTLLAALSFGLAQTPAAHAQDLTTAPAGAQAPTPQYLKDWRQSMAHSATPQSGCFSADYPSTQWQEVPCTTAPAVPYPPARGPGPRPATIGNGNDVSAEVTDVMSEAIGSFDSVIGVTSETGIEGPNSFSLQLNSNFFTSTACDGTTNPTKCLAWQQFVYSNSQCSGSTTSCTFMQYWLLDYGASCPGGWMSYQSSCYRNSAAIITVPAQTISALSMMSVTGQAVAGGQDTLVFAVGSSLYTVTSPDNIVNLSQGWQESEFNIVGDGDASQANFNAGSQIVVRTSVNNGTGTAPTCYGSGFTGETNNLYFVPASGSPTPGTLPAIVFSESTTSTATSPCQSAIGVAGSNQQTLTVSEVGSGTVTSSPSGIDCAAGAGSCSTTFATGTPVTLTASASADFIFAGWSGGGCAGIGTCVVTMSAAESVTATFNATLKVTENGTGTGQVTSSPAGINCSASSNKCSASFAVGASITLTASASAGSSFSGWSGGACSNSDTKKCDVTLSAGTTVNATFAKIPSFMLTVAPGGNGSGTVTSAPSGINCGSTCTASFQSGTQVTLTAAAASGSTFAGWSGGGCSGIDGCAVTLTANTSVVPTFVQDSTTNIALAAAVLPLSRSVEVGATATAFATMINAGPGTASTCTIAPATSIPASFVFQTTDSTTNALTGTANTPVDIPQGAAQSFVIAFTPTAAFGPADVAFTFGCANANPAPSTVGVNTLILSASTTPVPDIVALAASGDPGYVDIPGATGTGVFAVATANLGIDATITAAANTGAANLPVTLLICQTDPTSGTCLASPAPTATTVIPPNATPTFGIFVTGSAPVADMPGVNRVFVTFTDSTGTLRGETSVAVRTQ